jgi:trimeric autotransporter adhesin
MRFPITPRMAAGVLSGFLALIAAAIVGLSGSPGATSTPWVDPAAAFGACGPPNGATSSADTGSNDGTPSSCVALAPTAQDVSAFIKSLGINSHLSYPDTPYYGQSQRVISALQYLGINSIRDQSPAYINDRVSALANNTVAGAGIRFDALVPGNGAVNIAGSLANIGAFEQAHPGAIAAIEGPNEINDPPITYAGVTDSYSAGVQVTRDLWTAVQSNPVLAVVPVYALTLSNGVPGVLTGAREMGDLTAYVNYGNAHVYACCSNNVWQNDMPYWLPVFKQAVPRRPMVVTETGYQTIPSSVDEISAAKYNLNTLFENALHGITRTYLYELVDLNSSSTNTSSDDHFGEFHDDWTPKAGAAAIHNLTTILQRAGSGSASSSLYYSVSGLPATGHTYLLGSSTAFEIAVWIDATVYDPKSAKDIVAPVHSATVSLGSNYGAVTVYDPLIGDRPIAAYSNVSKLTVSVADHPVIVQVK